MSDTWKLTKTTNKALLSTPNPFEQKFGYYRAVRRGPCIAVSGTTAFTDMPTDVAGSHSGKIHFPGDAYKQSLHVFKVCVAAVEQLGGKKEDIIRVRMFVANSDDCTAVARALAESLGSQSETAEGGQIERTEVDMVGATATMIVVPGGFVDAEILVEIEVDGYVV